MNIFQQDGKEVFVLSSLINVFQVRPDAVALLLADLTEHAEELSKIGLTSLVMGKLMGDAPVPMDVQIPGQELLWMNDPELPSSQRLMIVMSSDANGSGGFSYGAMNMDELAEKQGQEGINPLEAMLSQGGDAAGLIGLLGALAADDGEGCGEDDCPACSQELDQTEDNVAGETRVS